MMGKLFPILIIGESFAAAIAYAAVKDYRRSLYWLFAGCIAITVTF